MTQLGVAPEMERNGMTSDYARALGARLRAIRTQQGLSLHGVEKKSRADGRPSSSARTSAATGR